MGEFCLLEVCMNRGILFAIGAYLIWGFMPVYIKQLAEVPPLQILGHRIVWSFLFLAIVIVALKQTASLRRAVVGKRVLMIYLAAALLLAVNWLTYIFAVNGGHVVESSLGYFINPLVSVLLGVVFFHERLRKWQWTAVAIATLGVLYLTFDYGQLPWIAIILALSFGLYGLVKKAAPLGALHGLTLETGLLFVPALVYLAWESFQGNGAFGAGDPGLSVLLAMAGLVTAIPLLMFGSAARSIPLSMVGLLQYIAPTCQFLLGVLVYREPFSPARLVGFVIIWCALVIFWVEGYLHRKARVVIN
jgi:chloramphenicol-sensitive protein RarD